MDLPPPPPPDPTAIAAANAAMDDVPCLVCGKTDGEDDFVLCETCPKGGHFQCLGMRAVPEDDWYCQACVLAKTSGEEGGGGGDAAETPAPAAIAAPIAAAYEPPAPPDVRCRAPLRLGVDVEERPMWGMDCYTRTAVFAAISGAAAFKGDDAVAAARREAFFTRRLMTTVHTMGEDGWDLALAAEKLRDEAKAAMERGGDAEGTSTVAPPPPPTTIAERDVVDACEHILRAIREVDEAGISTVPPPKVKLKTGQVSVSGYMMYCREARKDPCPKFQALSAKAKLKAMGRAWNRMDADEIARYEALAKEEKILKQAERAAEELAAAEAAEAAAAEEKKAKAAAEEEAPAAAPAPPPPPATTRRHFRLHPKGVGVVCIRPEGLPAGTYVNDYLGEIYAPWRWYERQDAIKKREPGKELPDFFNITLERPAEDAAGYDTLFVEAAHRCTFSSRLSHSCAPNVHTVGVVVDASESGGDTSDDKAAEEKKARESDAAKLTIAQYTTRRVEYGEELCWNYSCVTESEKEYRAAICLCSAPTCKGAFLDYAGSSAFTVVMARRHNFLDRNAILMRACSEPVTPADRALLAANGIKSSALTMHLPADEPRGDDRPPGASYQSQKKKPAVPRYAASDFKVGCAVKVYWRSDDAWYAGVIQDQQGAEGGADEGAVLSKIVYDDGDVETLDLVGGAEKVVLVTRADGEPTGDGDVEYDVDVEDDDAADAANEANEANDAADAADDEEVAAADDEEVAAADATDATDAKTTTTTDAGRTIPVECPEWLVKWAALTLEYVDLERALLPDALLEQPLDGIAYDAAFASATAAGVVATRLQNIIITLDKIKYVLRQPGQCRAPFLRPLTEEEVVDHLWSGEHGVLKRAAEEATIAAKCKGALAKRQRDRGGGATAAPPKPSVDRPDAASCAALRDLLDGPRPRDAKAARAGLLTASNILRDAPSGAHAAAADALFMYAHVEHWCTPEKFNGFTSPPVHLEPLPPGERRAKLPMFCKGDAANIAKKKYQVVLYTGPHTTALAW